MAPSNGGDVRARVNGGICLVARLIPETRVRVGHSESGATRAVVQQILLGSSGKPRGGITARGLKGLGEPSSHVDGFLFGRRHRAGSGGRVEPESGQRAGHRVDPPPAFEGRMQTRNVADIRGEGGKVRSSGAGAGMAAPSDGRASTRDAGHSEELCEHGSPPAALPQRRVSDGGPQAPPEPLTRPPRRFSTKNLLPIILNGGCANLDGTRPLKLKCSSRPELSTLKKPISIGFA
jgi:hypothetical protein